MNETATATATNETAKETATMNETATATATNETAKARNSYKLHDDSPLARLTLKGANAYMDATMTDFIAHYDGTAYAIASMTYEDKTRKDGSKSRELVIVTVNAGKIHVTVNTTAGMDYRKLARAYEGKHDKRTAKAAAKTANENTPEKLAEKQAKRRAAAVKRDVRWLMRRGFSQADAEKLAGTFKVTNATATNETATAAA